MLTGNYSDHCDHFLRTTTPFATGKYLQRCCQTRKDGFLAKKKDIYYLTKGHTVLRNYADVCREKGESNFSLHPEPAVRLE